MVQTRLKFNNTNIPIVSQKFRFKMSFQEKFKEKKNRPTIRKYHSLLVTVSYQINLKIFTNHRMFSLKVLNVIKR